MTSWFIVFFLSVGLAATAGGTVHGFYEDPSSSGSRILWPASLICLGITALSGTWIGAGLRSDTRIAIGVSRAAVTVFFFYCIVVLFISDDFVVAILDYLPAVLFLGWAFLTAYRKTKRPALKAGFAGTCMMLVAAGVQQAKLGIHPRYFNHNAVYHVLQAIALFMLFIPAREFTQSRLSQP